MTAALAIFRRELAAYFATPLAYIFIIVFLALAGLLTFFLGNFFERGRADLQPFFSFHPWLYLFLIPAVAMRLWAEDRKTGAIELLLTLPVPIWAAVLGKFLAAWVFCGAALALTFPFPIAVNILGSPDNGVIFGGYVGSWLLAGAYLAVGAAASALTRNQVIAFVLGAAACFLLTVAGTPVALGMMVSWAPTPLIDAVASMSALVRFQSIARGVIELVDLVYFLSVMAAFLFVNAALVELKKAE